MTSKQTYSNQFFLQSILDAYKIKPETKPIISFVGAGGKTGTIETFATAFTKDLNQKVIITTTTHIADPRTNDKDAKLFLWQNFAEKPIYSENEQANLPDFVKNYDYKNNKPLYIASSLIKAENKLCGIAPEWAQSLAKSCDILLLEADGSHRLPIKAPKETEPVIPKCANIVIGVVGLSVFGKEASSQNVHRIEYFQKITDCKIGDKITIEHIKKLILNPEGLFKNSPKTAQKIVCLNQIDTQSNRNKEELISELSNIPYTIVLQSLFQKTFTRIN